MATFALDGPGQGEAEWSLAIRPEWDEVGEVVIDYLQSLEVVDADRIGVWGVSLGGFYAARLASSGLPIRGTITLSGPFDFGASWANLNPLTRQAFQVRAHCSAPDEAEQRAQDLTLDGRAEKITTPLLVITGKQDRLFSWHDAERLAEESGGDTTLWLLDNGNHGCANVVHRHRPQSADWMADRLDVSDVA
jgi:2,6-dihydroxypseudooxynicotine hydrolase